MTTSKVYYSEFHAVKKLSVKQFSIFLKKKIYIIEVTDVQNTASIGAVISGHVLHQAFIKITTFTRKF